MSKKENAIRNHEETLREFRENPERQLRQYLRFRHAVAALFLFIFVVCPIVSALKRLFS